jgi:hypothetical protein
MMIFTRRLASEEGTRRFIIERVYAGWIAREEDEPGPPKTCVLRDWRQVEAIMAVFDMKVSALRDQGWAEL